MILVEILAIHKAPGPVRTAMSRGKNPRKEFHLEQHKESLAALAEEFSEDEISIPSEKEVDHTEAAERALWRENLLMWALYRADSNDFTQMEAHKQAIRGNGPTYAQSSLSRRLSKLEDEVLTSEIPACAYTPVFPNEDEDWKQYDEVLLEAERDRIMEAVLNERAFDLAHDPGIDEPEWARDRWPDLAAWEG